MRFQTSLCDTRLDLGKINCLYTRHGSHRVCSVKKTVAAYFSYRILKRRDPENIGFEDDKGSSN